MTISKIDKRALLILFDEFKLPKYGEMIRREVLDFEAGNIEVLSYGSEGDEVSVDLCKEKTVLTYELWIPESQSFAEGTSQLETSEVLHELKQVLCML